MTEKALFLALIALLLAGIADYVGGAYKGALNQVVIDHDVRSYDGHAD